MRSLRIVGVRIKRLIMTLSNASWGSARAFRGW